MLRGFTLVELMIYLALLGLVGIGIAAGYNFFLRSNINARTTAELRFDSTRALAPIRAILGRADSVDVVLGADGQQCAIATLREKTTRTGLYFGGDAGISLPEYRGVSGDHPRTVSFWMMQSDAGADHTIIDFGTPNPGGRWRIYTEAATGAVALDMGGAVIAATSDITDGNWNHVLVSYDNASEGDSDPSDSDPATFSPGVVRIYVNGLPETLIESGNPGTLVNTDNTSTPFTIGNSADGSSGFTGHLASVKFWERALTPPALWPEILSPTAVGRERLAAEITMANSISGTGPGQHSITALTNPRFTTRTRAYLRKISYGFAPAPENPALNRLWMREYIDTTDDQSLNLCARPTPEGGWALANQSQWLITSDDAFSLGGGVVSINAEAATEIGQRRISVGDDTVILIGQGVENAALCRIAPPMTGFDTGGSPITEAVVRIDDASFEAATDTLTFFDAARTGPITTAINGDNHTYYSFKDIRADGAALWPHITAEYTPQSGVMRICTSTGDNCTRPNLATPQSLDAWGKVFDALTYKANSQTYGDEKAFLFTLGGAIPCPIENHLACRAIGNDDFDDDADTCYHYFDFVSFDDLGSDYACHEVTGGDAAAYGQCPADWEDARVLAGGDAYRLFGLEGYLATITTRAELVCSDAKIPGAWGWVGASDRACERDNSCGDPALNTALASGPYGKFNSKDTPGEGYWYWVTGPEGAWSSAEAGYQDHEGGGGGGQALYIGHGQGSAFTTFDPPDLAEHIIPRSFTNWADGQPNDWAAPGSPFPTQDYMQTYLHGVWNDDSSHDRAGGFLLEYGGMQGDPGRVLTKRTRIDTFAFLKNCGG